MQLSTEWTTDADMEDESQMQADGESDFELSGRNRRESSEQGCSFCRIFRPRYRKRGGQTTSRKFSVWCESQTSDLAFSVQTEQKDRADLVAQLGATSEALRTRWRSSAVRINKQSPDIAGGVNVGNEILTLALVIGNVRAPE